MARSPTAFSPLTLPLSRTAQLVEHLGAEIRTGRRTIADYLLSPIARRTSESLHER